LTIDIANKHSGAVEKPSFKFLWGNTRDASPIFMENGIIPFPLTFPPDELITKIVKDRIQ